MDGITVSIDAVDDRLTRVRVAGELDMNSARDVDDAIATCLKSPTCSEIRMDLGGLTFCDSIGLGAIADAAQACSEKGITFVVERVSDRVRSTFERAGVTELFGLERRDS